MKTLPRAGVLLFGSNRFRKLGDSTRGGAYEARQEKFAGEFTRKLSSFAEPFYNGIIYGRNDVREAVKFFMERDVECVICSFLSWSEDRPWISFLRDMYDIPVILYAGAVREPGYRKTEEENDFISFLSNGGLVGGLEGSGSAPRTGRNIQVAAGDYDSGLKSVKNFVRAASAKSKLREAVFGLVSGYNELMWSTYVNPYDMFARIGPEVRFISYSRLKEEIERVGDKPAEAYMREISSRYKVEEGIDGRLFLESARASLGLDSIRERFGLDALVLNDVDSELFELTGLRPGFYPDAFNENGAVLVPEGDLGAGVISYALKHMTGNQVNFVEPFYFNSEMNTFAAGHAGVQDYNYEKNRQLVRVSKDTRFAKSDFKYAGAPFAWYRFPPGIKTFAHFSETSANYKIICFIAESLPGEHDLSGYSHSEFRPEKEAGELFSGVLKTGSTQHFAVAEGDVRDELSFFARINNFEFYKF